MNSSIHSIADRSFKSQARRTLTYNWPATQRWCGLLRWRRLPRQSTHTERWGLMFYFVVLLLTKQLQWGGHKQLQEFSVSPEGRRAAFYFLKRLRFGLDKSGRRRVMWHLSWCKWINTVAVFHQGGTDTDLPPRSRGSDLLDRCVSVELHSATPFQVLDDGFWKRLHSSF